MPTLWTALDWGGVRCLRLFFLRGRFNQLNHRSRSRLDDGISCFCLKVR